MRRICRNTRKRTKAAANPPKNQVGVKRKPSGGGGMVVADGVGVIVTLGAGVSLGGGVTRAPEISAFSVPNRSRPGVWLAPGVGLEARVGLGGMVAVLARVGSEVSPGRRVALGKGVFLSVAVGEGGGTVGVSPGPMYAVGTRVGMGVSTGYEVSMRSADTITGLVVAEGPKRI